MKIKVSLLAIFLSTFLSAQITVSLLSSTASCLLPCNGTVNVIATGGTPPYSYTILPNAINNATGSFTGICSGSYTVTVTDATFNIGTYSSTVATISAPSITTVTTTGILPPSNYEATVTYTGGQPRYIVQWFYEPSGVMIRQDLVSTLNDTITHLSPGDYGVIVTDSVNSVSGCQGLNQAPYLFSICDPSIGVGFINFTPNDTVCPGTPITINYITVPMGQINILYQVFMSDNPNCDPSASNGTFSCNISQTTTFTGFWAYSATCAPIPFAPVTITVLPCVGINEQQSTNFVSIFPNPGNGAFTLKTNQTTAVQLEIFDETGRNCYTSSSKNGDEIFTGLKSGIYFIRILSDAGTKIEKLVITNK